MGSQASAAGSAPHSTSGPKTRSSDATAAGCEGSWVPMGSRAVEDASAVLWDSSAESAPLRSLSGAGGRAREAAGPVGSGGAPAEESRREMFANSRN